MSPSYPSGEEAAPEPARQSSCDLGKRTKVACKSCHRRRVKCDATDEQPCWHCRLRGTPCELIESRRGKYIRKKSICPVPGPSTGSRMLVPAGTAVPAPVATAALPDLLPTSPSVLMRQSGLEKTHSPDGTATTLCQAPSPPSTVGRSESERAAGSTAGEGPEMLYTRIVDSEYASSPPGAVPENVRYFYMGEPFSLGFVVRSLSNNVAHAGSLQLHHPVPHTVAEYFHDGVEGITETDPAVLASLNVYGAFELPPQNVSDELVRIFFESIHPAYPVFDRHEFSTLYRQKKVSLLALQTVFFLALTICSEETLKAAGYTDRFLARRTVYLRAKAFFDVGYEKNKVTVAAVLFLLGFWWEGPEDQKDSWHWLGAAISLTQTLGFHRSTANSGMPFRQRALLKRIWWSIYIRDRHAAAALGRPCRIQDEDCDVEMLNSEDFAIDRDYDRSLICEEQDYHRAYVIEMAKLAQILGRILKREFAPNRASIAPFMPDVYSELQEWELNLPPVCRRISMDDSLQAPYWSCMLFANYHNCQILLLRPRGAALPANHVQVEKTARDAADSITRIVEDLLAAGTMKLAQLHLVPALFAALSIHTIVIQRRESVQRQLAENRARQCILAFGELARGWPVAGWVMGLFINLMKRLTSQAGGNDGGASHTRGAEPAPHQQTERDFASPSKNPDELSYMPFDHDTAFASDEASLGQTNQLLSDIIWAPLQNDFDGDFMFGNPPLNTGFMPFNIS